MARKFVHRTLSLKWVRYNTGRRKDFEPVPMDEILRIVLAKAQTVGERHYPPPAEVNENTPWCMFINQSAKKPAGVLVEICRYIPGLRPDAFLRDMGAHEADVQPTQVIDDKTGQPKEVVTTFRLVARGEAIILESVQGSGGVQNLQNYLYFLANLYIKERYQKPHLSDVTNRDMHQAIIRGGGVSSIVMDLSSPHVSDTATYGKMLSSVRHKIRGATFVRTEVKSDSELVEADIMEALDEYREDEGISRVAIKLRKGGTIHNADKFKEWKSVSVAATESGHPNAAELQREMWDYLKDLQSMKAGSRILDETGNFVSVTAEADD